jgi:hypothetical protein
VSGVPRERAAAIISPSNRITFCRVLGRVDERSLPRWCRARGGAGAQARRPQRAHAARRRGLRGGAAQWRAPARSIVRYQRARFAAL